MYIRTLSSAVAILLASIGTALAACPNVSWQQLTDTLKANIAPTGGPSNGGLDFNMWATIVSPEGRVCMVTKSGDSLNAQWLGSRVISAQKANTAVLFSLTQGLALSTANLYAAVQPGGSLFGLQFSNPVNPHAAYRGNEQAYGTDNDPLVGSQVGGVNVFGGGLPLYDGSGNLIGALGVSGDTSCADHNVAWRVRQTLGLNNVPAGVNEVEGNDNIIYDDVDGNNNGVVDGFEHPECGNNEKAVNATL
ncbi:MAG: heme-binding protein [Methylohalobius sp. ZOD2]|uniref:heme-binding protein n=1 Tax=Methylohalobius crimeensis TaxID=244365 RepID=UPI0003B63F7E|nr:heme-binding protein [Methylohalobius crimeensis]